MSRAGDAIIAAFVIDILIALLVTLYLYRKFA